MAVSRRGRQACAGAGTERIADAHAQRTASIDFPPLEICFRKAPCYRLPARRHALEVTWPGGSEFSAAHPFRSNTILQSARLSYRGPPGRERVRSL